MGFAPLTVVAATGGTLAVFHLRHDWPLLGAPALLLLALAWAGVEMIPGAIDQVTLLLSLGAVQEGERILWHGVPHRAVERELARLCVDACNGRGRKIPCPQLVLHNATA